MLKEDWIKKVNELLKENPVMDLLYYVEDFENPQGPAMKVEPFLHGGSSGAEKRIRKHAIKDKTKYSLVHDQEGYVADIVISHEFLKHLDNIAEWYCNSNKWHYYILAHGTDCQDGVVYDENGIRYESDNFIIKLERINGGACGVGIAGFDVDMNAPMTLSKYQWQEELNTWKRVD